MHKYKKRIDVKKLLIVLTALAMSSLVLAQGTILEVAQADDRLETLVSAAAAAGLTEVLSSEGPFTVFAPTDRAFNRLSGLEELLAQPETLRRILLAHVVPSVVTAAEAAAVSPLPSVLEGVALPIRVIEGTLYVGDAIVTITDIPASNGVIHVIDTVLTPPFD